MKIVLAPDKFKGCLDAASVAAAMARGVASICPAARIDPCPIADGGEGIVAALVAATGGRIERRRVTGPLPEMKIDAFFGVLGDGRTAVVEMAAASGLALLRIDDRNPLNTTTFGTGELLVAASRLGVERIILGIGGSATTDAGIGCAQACELPVILEDGQPVSPTEPLCGRDLESVVLIKHGRGGPVERVKIVVACDVDNPLYGPNGAAVVYGPQKGASPQEVRWLDEALCALARRTGKTREAETPGAGAAGGLGFGMLAFFGARLRGGVDIVMDAVKLRERLNGADLCLTGEGRLDASTLAGKAPIGVASLCREMSIPCIAIAGSVDPAARAALRDAFTAIYELADGALPVEQSIHQAPQLIEAVVAKAVAGGVGFR